MTDNQIDPADNQTPKTDTEKAISDLESLDQQTRLESLQESSGNSQSDNKKIKFGFPIIGIGASAGGIESLEELFGQLPANTHAAFVVVQHLSPDFKSMMTEILSRRTDLEVCRIEDQMKVKPKTVYLIPPNKDLDMKGNLLQLKERNVVNGVSHPIDRFFSSMAQSCGTACTALVCSGSGSDGSRGIRDVCENGGMVLVEDPDTATFDGMPRSAVESGVVDFVAPIAELAIWIGRFIESFNDGTLTQESLIEIGKSSEQFSGLKAVTELLRKEYQIDFLQYKPNMILRRIERRLQLMHFITIDEYVRQLQDDREELNQLYRDLLIGVTRFFRDPDAFKALSEKVLPDLVRSSADRTLRVWAPGCATGEEAYSLAITIVETMKKLEIQCEVKIFATDAHRLSLDKAAMGMYSGKQLLDLPQSIVEEHFEPTANNFRVKQHIRKLIVFAPQNLLKDASFTNVDLTICRNTLIYFKLDGQRRALALMHFGLRLGGYLFLGPSESPGPIKGDYETIDRRWRIYKKIANSQVGLSELRMPRRSEEGNETPIRSTASIRADRLIFNSLEEITETYVPPTFVTDAEFRLVYSTPGAADFMRRQEGKFDATLPDMLVPQLKTTVLIGLQRAARQDLTEPVLVGKIPIKTRSLSGKSIDGDSSDEDSSDVNVRIIIRKIVIASENNHGFVVTLEREMEESFQRPTFVDNLDATTRATLEDELRHTKENLQASIQELETSNEELQATNEEMVAANEELQSTNEELHSVNEELYTVNSEHQHKIEELTELTEDMENLFRASDLATIFLDEELRIRRLTPKASQIFSLTEDDVGRSLENFRNPLKFDGLEERIRQTSEVRKVFEKEVQSHDGRRFLLRLLPYSSCRMQKGTVLTLIDLHRLESARKKLERNEVRFRGTFENAAVGIAHVGLDGEWLRVNERLCDIVGYSRQELLASNFQAITHPEDLKADLDQLEQLKRGEIDAYSMRKRYIHREGHEVTIDLTVSLQREPHNNEPYCISVVQDATENVQFQQKLEEAVKQRDQFLAVLSHELRNPLASLRNVVQLLQKLTDENEKTQAYISVLDRQTEHMARLVEDLLDTSRVTQNQIKLQRELVDLKSLVKESVSGAQSGFTLKDLELSFVAEGDKFPVVGDTTRLLQVMENLLSNARRYTPAGGSVKVKLFADAGDAVVSVIDNGSGIDQQKLDLIFEMFGRATDTKETQGGLGIGLALSKMLMEQHEGSISAHSDGHGKGATFSIRLPLAPIPETGVQEKVQNDSMEIVRPMKIVLVEDDDDARLTMQALLELDGHQVETAADGLEGLAVISEKSPDVALIDLSMPGLNGIELANELVKQGVKSKLIALTGHGQAADRKKTKAANFIGHITKPVDMDELNRLMFELEN
ncbi:MAG: chemotaxis protein CheB [Planctomycetota bacterium]